MPEQQKVDETIESINITADKKIPKKIENSSTALEKEEASPTIVTGYEDDDNNFLESDVEDSEKI